MEVDISAAERIEPHLLLDVGFVADAARRAPAAMRFLSVDALTPNEQAEVYAQLRGLTLKNPALFRHLPDLLRADRTLVESLVDSDPSVIAHVKGGLQNDAALWLRAAKSDASVLSKVDIKTSLGKQLLCEPAATELRDVALLQLAGGRNSRRGTA